MVASYPYDDSPTHRLTGVYSKSADDEVFKYLAKAYASHHPIMRTGKPNCPGEEGETFPDGITNGAQWYDVEGKLCSPENSHPVGIITEERTGGQVIFLALVVFWHPGNTS